MPGSASRGSARRATAGSPCRSEARRDRREVSQLDSLGRYGDGRTPDDPEHEAEGDVAEPVHAEHEPRVNDKQGREQREDPRPAGASGERDAAEEREDDRGCREGVAGGEGVAGLVDAGYAPGAGYTAVAGRGRWMNARIACSSSSAPR